MHQDARNLSDRELLVLIHDRTERIEHSIYGNGSPGLMKEFEVLRAKMDERTAPTKVSMLGLTGATFVFLTAATEFLKSKMNGN